MAQDFISALFGSAPDYSAAMSPEQTKSMQQNALAQGGIGALIAMLGASGQTNRPISTGQALAGALGAGYGGYQSSFDTTLKQMLTAQQLSEYKQKQEAKAKYEQAIKGATTQMPQNIPMAQGQGSQFEMLSRPEFGGDMAGAETVAALRGNLPMTEVVDAAAANRAAMDYVRGQYPEKFLELTAKSAKEPGKVQEYQYAQTPEGGGFKGSFADFIKSGTPSTSVTLNTEKSYGGAIAGKMADIDATRYDIASRSPAVLDQVNRTRKILDSGNVFVGALANPKLELARFGQEIGVGGKNTDELVANTQTLMAGRAQSTLDSIKASGLGSGQGFTDKDRQFLENARLGNITYSKKAIQDQLDIEEKVARASAQSWNDRFDQIPKSAKEPLGLQKINLPSSADLAKPGVKKYNPLTKRIE